MNDQPVRHYKVHLPANFKNDRGHAVVSERFTYQWCWYNRCLSSRKKGTDGRTAWQGAPYSAPGVDYILFIKTMITQLENTFCIDTSRIYATGKSNGGGFVNLLACTQSISGKFAAFATVSATFYRRTFNRNCAAQHPIPLLDFRGTADTVIRYSGGKSHCDRLFDIDSFWHGWALQNGCQSNATISHLSKQTDPRRLVEIRTWHTNCKKGGIVIGYKIIGGQHGWPRMTLPAKCNGKAKGNDCSTTVFDATADVIIPFFNKYSL